MAAQRNASELLVFGNPPGHKRGCKCFACKHARARKNPGELLIFGNPSSNRAAVLKHAQQKANEFGRTVFVGRQGKFYSFRFDTPYTREMGITNVKAIKPNPAARDRGLSETRKAARRRVAIKRQLRARGVKLTGSETLEQLRALRRANPKRATKRRRRGDRRNPDESRAAVRLFEKFHGRDPKEITEKHVSAAHRKDYTALGDLEHLKVLTPLGQTAQFNFEDDGVMLASSADGKQLYCIGGNQNLSQCLDAASLEKDFIDLGEAIEVQYLARKIHGNFEPVSYFHKFGEKTGARPQLAYDKLKKQIFFVGGEYFIDTKQGVSPGIEN